MVNTCILNIRIKTTCNTDLKSENGFYFNIFDTGGLKNNLHTHVRNTFMHRNQCNKSLTLVQNS